MDASQVEADLPAWLGTVTHRARVLAVSSTPPLVFGRFVCPPDDPAWSEDNDVGGTFHLAFPLTPVAITPEGQGRFAADQHQVVLHDPERSYRRAMLDPRGSSCWFIATRADLLAELGETGPGAAIFDRVHGRFLRTAHPLPRPTFVTLQELGRAAAAGTADDLQLQSVLLDVLRSCSQVVEEDPPAAGSETTARAHRRLVEDTREVLAATYRCNRDLGEIAREVGASPYHLHRVFRTHTGTTIHRYREDLRLRDAYARVVEGAENLAEVAVDVGYANHSHMTARFRRGFGTTPSAVRLAASAIG